jgi:hypothetical protein
MSTRISLRQPHIGIDALWLWIIAQISVDHQPRDTQASRKKLKRLTVRP